MERTSRMRSGGGPSRVARTMGRNTTAAAENTGRLMRAVGDASAEMISGGARVFSNFFADAMDSAFGGGRYAEDRGYRGGYRHEERYETRRGEGGEYERSGRYEREDEGGRVEVEAHEERSTGERPRRGSARDWQDDFQRDVRDRAGNVGGTMATAIRDSARVLSRSMERFSDAFDTRYVEDEDEEFEASGDRYVHEERTVRRGGEGAREETTRTVRVEAAAPRTEEKRKVETTKVERTEEKKS